MHNLYIPWLFLSMLFFMLGSCVGSFLNVCIYRLPRNMSIVLPPSHCPSCKTKLNAIDLIPILNFIFLKAHCRYCGAKIHWRYPAVELVGAILFVALFNLFGLSYKLIWSTVLASIMVVVFAIDFEHLIIPDELSIAAIALGIAKDAFELVTQKAELILHLPASIWGSLFGATFFIIMGLLGKLLFKKEAIGGGDIKLGAAIGANLLILQAFYSFILAICLGAIIGVFLLALKIKSRGEYIPFGPFMALSALIFTLYGPGMVNIFNRLYSLY